MLNLTRYVHLNPVKIKSIGKLPLTERLQLLRQYRWSSFRSYAGLSRREEWVSYEPLMQLVAQGRRSRSQAYRRYVEAGLAKNDQELMEALSYSSKTIGSKSFCRWVEEKYRQLTSRQAVPVDVARRRREVAVDPQVVIQAVSDLVGIDKQSLVKRRGNSLGRDLLMQAWREYSALTERNIGFRIGHGDGLYT